MTKQTYIPGTEPPPDEQDPPVIEVIAEAVDSWLKAKKKQALANEATQMRHEILLGHMQEHSIERYPFIDERTGRKRYVVADRTPKAKTINAPSPKETREPSEKREGQVEVRRVPRTEVAADLDPFSKTREQLEQPEKRSSRS